jgi:hypothetical protein
VRKSSRLSDVKEMFRQLKDKAFDADERVSSFRKAPAKCRGLVMAVTQARCSG